MEKQDRKFPLSQQSWDKIKHLFPPEEGRACPQPTISNYMVVSAVIWLARAGAPWRDLPEEFGSWNSIYKRFSRWSRPGVWTQVFKSAAEGLPDEVGMLIDSTIVRAHVHAAGAPKERGGAVAQALGVSRGGFGTKIHVTAVDDRTPVACILTGGNKSDYEGYDPLMEALSEDIVPCKGIMDKGYDSNEIREDLKSRGIEPVIPPRSNRKELIHYDKKAYRERNCIERFFGRIKQFRRVATRYEKLASHFEAMIYVAVLVQCVL